MWQGVWDETGSEKEPDHTGLCIWHKVGFYSLGQGSTKYGLPASESLGKLMSSCHHRTIVRNLCGSSGDPEMSTLSLLMYLILILFPLFFVFFSLQLITYYTLTGNLCISLFYLKTSFIISYECIIIYWMALLSLGI